MQDRSTTTEVVYGFIHTCPDVPGVYYVIDWDFASGNTHINRSTMPLVVVSETLTSDELSQAAEYGRRWGKKQQIAAAIKRWLRSESANWLVHPERGESRDEAILRSRQATREWREKREKEQRREVLEEAERLEAERLATMQPEERAWQEARNAIIDGHTQAMRAELDTLGPRPVAVTA